MSLWAIWDLRKLGFLKKKCMNHAPLFQWKTLCINSFPYFPVFGSIRKIESKENYIWLT